MGGLEPVLGLTIDRHAKALPGVLEEGDAGAVQVKGDRAHRSELRGQALGAVSVEREVALQRLAVLYQP